MGVREEKKSRLSSVTSDNSQRRSKKQAAVQSAGCRSTARSQQSAVGGAKASAGQGGVTGSAGLMGEEGRGPGMNAVRRRCPVALLQLCSKFVT